MTPADAVDAGRFHHQLLPPDLIMYGPSRPLDKGVVSELEQRGYRLKAPFDFGDIQVIYDNGTIVRAASDPRHNGESRVLDQLPM